jgi:hypothetical protein
MEGKRGERLEDTSASLGVEVIGFGALLWMLKLKREAVS